MNATVFVRLLYELLLKVRILREHEKATVAIKDMLSERELLALELISKYAPIKESQLGKILGLQTSSLAELVKRLVKAKYVEKIESKTDKRQRPLPLGEEQEADSLSG